MATEVEMTLNWMESTLSADTTLQGYAPGGVQYVFPLPGILAPYVVIKYQPGSGKSHPVFGGNKAYVDMLFHAMVAGPMSSLTALQSAGARIETLLTVLQTVVTGGAILACFQDQPISEDVWVDSQKWRLTGAVYQVMAKAT